MTISQRAPVDGVICDVVCTGRFYDFFEKRDGRWGFVLRRLVYEKDRLDPVDPSAKLALDQDLLKQFPGRLSSPRLSADQDRLQGEDRHAGPRRSRSRRALRAGRALACRADHPNLNASRAHRRRGDSRCRRRRYFHRHAVDRARPWQKSSRGNGAIWRAFRAHRHHGRRSRHGRAAASGQGVCGCRAAREARRTARHRPHAASRRGGAGLRRSKR